MSIGNYGPVLIVLIASLAVAQTSAPAGQQKLSRQPHVLGLKGAPNFRDLGGYATLDGHHVRYGMVYRSNKLSALTEADERAVDDLHLVAEVDLRTAEERKSEPSRWLHHPADLYESPKFTLAPTLDPIIAEIHDASSARAALTDFYAEMPDVYRAEYTALFRLLLERETPLVVHCTAGKDRTGVAAAVLLSALGVSRSAVVADYALTTTLLPPPKSGPAPKNLPPALAALYALPTDARAAVWRADPAYIEAALDAINHEYGSIHGYLRQGLGLSEANIQTLKSDLTE